MSEVEFTEDVQECLTQTNNKQIEHAQYESKITHKTPLSEELFHPPYNRLRRAKIILFDSMLSDYTEYSQSNTIDDKTRILKQIERSCYNHTIQTAKDSNITTSWALDIFCEIYHDICYKVSVNLEKNGIVGNPTLTKQILQGNVSIENLPNLASHELFPDKYVDVLARVEASKNINRTIKYSAMYKCRVCKKSQCTIENRYNRSLDEGVNLSITCVNCGHEWNA